MDYNNISKQKEQAYHRPHEEEEKKEATGDNRKKPPPPPPPASAFANDKDVKQRARSSAMRAASSGVYRKPPPGGIHIATATANGSVNNAATLDAIAKSRGRRGNNNDPRKQQQRQLPSSYQRNSSSTSAVAVSAASASSSSASISTGATKLSRLEEEVTAKARGKANYRNNSNSMTKRSPQSSIMSRRDQADAATKARSRLSPSSNIKQLNRMEADVAAKEKTRAGRTVAGVTRSTPTSTTLNRMEADVTAKARAKAARSAAINGARSSSSTTGTTTFTPSSSSLNRMEADVAAKAKSRAGRVSSIAMSAVRDQQSKNGNDIIAKKLSKTGGGRRNNQASLLGAATRPGAVSSTMADNGDYEDRIAYKTGTNRLAGGGGKNKRKDGMMMEHDDHMMDKKKSHYAAGGDAISAMGQRGGNGSGSIDDETMILNKDGNHDDDDDDGDRLAVAVAVNEDDDENVFIPSAVEYDPDAMKTKVPMFKNQRFRVYGLLGCTLLIILAACSIGVLAILEGKEEQYSPPTEAPTCIRCSVDFEEQLELEVGSQKLNDPTTAEYQAKEWIIYEDPMQLQSNDRNLIQRFILAAFYFETHQLSNWRSCNRPSVPESGVDVAEEEEDFETCSFMKMTGIRPLTFEEFSAIRWLSSYNECDWAGITCDEMKQVRSIDLHAHGMEGPFPVVLTRLPYVQTLSLQWNNFTGTLPEEIGSMKHLIHAELHSNMFTGSFPNTWSNARNLQLLNLAENSLSGQIPQDMGNFRNIKGLFMYKNKFSGTLPPELSQAKTLSFARLQKNAFTGTIPSNYGDMQLSELWLQGNSQLTGTIPTELGRLANYMSDLRLSETTLEGTIPEEIFSFSSMWRLDLYEAGFSGTISPNITKLESLEVLRLNDNRFTGKLPTDFSYMTNLITVTLSGNKFSGSVPSSLCNLKKDHNLVFVEADCLSDSTTGIVAITCDCCDICCNAETGECS